MVIQIEIFVVFIYFTIAWLEIDLIKLDKTSRKSIKV